jgi:integrase/recombinase XerC
VRPHGLRHTAVTALLDAGVGLREAPRFSRHADPRTLVRYGDNRADLAAELARTLSELV